MVEILESNFEDTVGPARASKLRGSEGAGGEGRDYVAGSQIYCAATGVFQAQAANNDGPGFVSAVLMARAIL